MSDAEPLSVEPAVEQPRTPPMTTSSPRTETLVMKPQNAQTASPPAKYAHSRSGSASTLLRLATVNSQATSTHADPLLVSAVKSKSPVLQPTVTDDSSLIALGLLSANDTTPIRESINPASPPTFRPLPLQMMPVSDVPKNTHKGRSSSLSSLWKPIRRESPARETESKGHSHQWADIQHISSPIPPGMMDDTFAFPSSEETSGGSNLNAMAAMARQIQANGSPKSQARMAPSLVSPSPSEKKRNQLSLRRIFQHRKSTSKSSSMHERQRSDDHSLEPTISSPWGLTVASFRPAPVPKTTMTMSESTPDLRQLTIENAILISRESDSNGLLAQSRAREMPAPLMPIANGYGKGTRLERSKSLGQYVVSGDPSRDEDYPRPRRYEASSMCEKFVLPRPRLVALTITPPSSPPQRATSESQTQRTYSSRPEGHVIGRTSQLWEPSNEDERGASPSLSGHRVLREGVQRDREREDWAAKARTAPSQRLRMRVPSAGRDAHQDKKYQLARFAPQPVGFEPVYDLELPSSHVVGRRIIKQRSGSLGNLIAADRSGDHGAAASMQRRDSKPAFTRRTATSSFLRHLAQSMRNRKAYPEHDIDMLNPPDITTRSVSNDNTLVRKASLPSLKSPVIADYRDKPLPAEPIEPSSKRSSAIRHSVSSPNLRTVPLADSEGIQSMSTPPSLATRDSAIDLLNDFVVADRLAHPVERAAIPSSGVKSPPAPIRILREGDVPLSQPFTPTRQAAWDQWHTMQPRSPSSPIPERLPLDTVLALASRQLTSPRQKRPSMEEAVNRARMANQLFGDTDSQHSSSNTPVQVLSVGPSGRLADCLSATTIGSPQRESQNGAQGFSPRSPRTVQLLMATPGSTDASPMPGASFEDIERDLFFARPRRLWGTPVALPSRENGHHQRLNSADSSKGDRRLSKVSAGSSSTRMALTSDDHSQDNHGQVEVTTPNLSQDGYGVTRFSAISEEDRQSESGNSDLLDLDDSRVTKGSEWPQRRILSRDVSGNTVLHFDEVDTYLPLEIQPRSEDGQANLLRDSMVPESGRLDLMDGVDGVDLKGLGSDRMDDSAMASNWPADDTSSESSATSFATAQSALTIRAAPKPPGFSRQNTDTTTMSWTTARAEL